MMTTTCQHCGEELHQIATPYGPSSWLDSKNNFVTVVVYRRMA